MAEAVSWQAQEFLPTQTSDLVMDWRIVNKNETGYEVLIVTIKKDLLSGYLKSTEAAGLFPLAVDIPSIGLVKLSGKNEEGILLVYKNFDEILIVLSQKEKIIGTSVVRSDDTEEILKVASRMIAHYKDVTTF